jgi:hypothetical protein
MIAYPIPRHAFSTYEAARRVWIIRQLLDEKAMEVHAAALALGLLAEHPNARVRALAVATQCDIADRFIARQEIG